MIIVLDTNVIVSALMNSSGIPSKILQLIMNKKIKIMYDNSILFEYISVLSREHFGFNSEIIDKMIVYFKKDGEYINAEYSQINFTDESDKKFYDVYKTGKADYLITGNIKHFPKDARIVTPRKFIEKMQDA
jgi:putative PIN family toxin of toxin-antitoxin system